MDTLADTRSVAVQLAAPLQGADLDARRDGSRPLVMVIDDDADFVAMVKIILRQAGFDVVSDVEPGRALERLPAIHPNLVLLDITMPGMDGWTVFQRLREVSDIPVIALTASARPDDAVRGLTLGMDEYITKPFYNPELVARINATLRRSAARRSSSVQSIPGLPLLLNAETRQATLNGRELDLSRREFEVLQILVDQAPAVVTHQAIARAVWNRETSNETGRVKNVIASLRRKMEADPHRPDLILNHSGVGYRIRITG